MKGITPNFWFDHQAEEAANFYVSVFPNSKVGNITRYNETVSKVAGRPAGSVMTVEFELDGQTFVGLNGGPIFKFSEAVSFIVNCEGQEEIDRYWNALTADGGQESQCGWLKDKFGVSWQITPSDWGDMLTNATPAQAERLMAAMLPMKKFDLAALQRAFDGN